MRFVVYGAGAIGGVVGGRLFQHGYEVVLIARGKHFEAIRADGLLLEDPAGAHTLPIPAVQHPRDLEWRDDDVCLIAVKSQHSAQVLADLAATAPPQVPVVCLQNGVRNEEWALRRFPNVYGVPVLCPAGHLDPGAVQAFSAPVTGIFDVGRFPAGVDETAEAIAAAFTAAGFDSRAVPDVMRWKWRKLIMNLGNAVDAVCGPAARGGPIAQQAFAEGEACLVAAGVDVASTTAAADRRGNVLQRQPVAGRDNGGGSSSWQSLARHAGSIEIDYLNGEIVLLGRLHNVPTPVNTLLQQLANRLAASPDSEPGSVSPVEFDDLLAAAAAR